VAVTTSAGCGGGAVATPGSPRCKTTRRPIVSPIAAKAKRTGRNSTKTSPWGAVLGESSRSDGGGESVMTIDLSGPVISRPQLWVAPLGRFCPQRPNSYILMPESRFGHNNTIGLTWFFRLLADCQTIAILRLTPQRSAHISAAPTANGAYRNIARNCGAGFFDPDGSRLAKGSRPPGRAFYASFVWKGIRRRRRSSVP
jgi:hypothetical protein